MDYAHNKSLPTIGGSGVPELFQLAGWILKVLPSRSDRELLSGRIAAKVSGARRGRLYLPLHFPEEVRRLTQLTTGQLRESTGWFNASSGIRYRIKRSVADYIHRVLPGGCVRTVNGNHAAHVRQSKLVKPLRQQDWPRLGTRAAWPSSPTVTELLAMGKRGDTPLPLNRKPERSKRSVSLALYNSNVVLRQRIVSQQVVGIRSDVEVPKKFLGHFRYRAGVLLLTSTAVPAGLVRFLTGQWIRNPHNLWLREKIGFKTFLKSLDFTAFSCVTPGPW